MSKRGWKGPRTIGDQILLVTVRPVWLAMRDAGCFPARDFYMPDVAQASWVPSFQRVMVGFPR